ncbi:MAG: hypothetical protein V4619_16850 [Bacteroidota bacterium]
MAAFDLTLTLDSRVHVIEFCRLEAVKFEPQVTSFNFKNGKWIAEHKSFPVSSDNVLDLMIIVRGNPGTTCELTVKTKQGTTQKFAPNQEFAPNGYAFFDPKVQLS